MREEKTYVMTYYITTTASPVGTLTLGSDGKSLVSLWTEGRQPFDAAAPGELLIHDSLPVFQEVKDWLNRYFDGKRPQISELPLAPRGSAFRQAVWKMLTDIPYGEVVTYGELAKRIAEQRGVGVMSAQAVGGAAGHNPIPIIIPCHRVVGANGNLTGFSCGIPMKRQLLKHEGVDISRFYDPRKGQRFDSECQKAIGMTGTNLTSQRNLHEEGAVYGTTEHF